MKPSFPRAFTIFRWLIPSAVCGLSAGAAPLYKVNNSDDLNLLTSWSTTSGAQAPNPGVLDPSDIWYFNEVTMLGSKTVSLGGNMTIAGIGLDYATANSANDLVINAGGTLTLNGGTLRIIQAGQISHLHGHALIFTKRRLRLNQIFPIKGGEGAGLGASALRGIEATARAVIAHPLNVFAAGDVRLAGHDTSVCVLRHAERVWQFDPLHCIDIHR